MPETESPLKCDHGALPPDSPLYACLGRIAAVLASFESALDNAICVHGYMKEEIRACFTSQLNGPFPRLKVLVALLRLDKDVSAASIELMNRLAPAIAKLVEQRNMAFSRLPLQDDHSGDIGQFRVESHGQPDHESLAASLAELEILLSEITETLKRFRALCIRIADESYAAWKKRQP